ncbi:MAG TPA: T9SS type A sorting domain-containing protein [Moheibacter sp.]|nr:T9SS type A sorting domain-containing protein [Moheibacter sp.]
MKKIYFLALSLMLGFGVNAQILTDDFESYPLGPYFGGHWSNWSNTSGPENIIIADDQSTSGTQSGFIGSDGIQDPVLVLGLRESGLWTVQFNMYIDFGSTGYFNIQQTIANMGVDGNWANQFYFGIEPIATPAVTPGIGYVTGTEFYYPFAYPEEQWFTVKLEVDLSAGTLKMYFDGELVELDPESPDGSIPYGGDQFMMEAMNFYSHSDFSSNAYYLDDIVFVEGEMGVADMTGAAISVYPTVVKDMVNISAKSNISDIAVFNTAGQQVLKSNPNSVSTQVNMTSLPAGVYIVKIQAGKETLTKKVVVK